MTKPLPTVFLRSTANSGKPPRQDYITSSLTPGSVGRDAFDSQALKGFRKVHLEPGASAQVEFTLTKENLSYYNHDLQWVCEPGDFEIMIGPNSGDTEGVTLRVQS